MLELAGLSAWHGAAQVVRSVSLQVPAGHVTAIVGPNGAGKTTLARAVAGLHRAKAGSVAVAGRDVSSDSTVDVARAGISLVPQGRKLFPSLTVAEHLALARRHRRPDAVTPGGLLVVFPHLERRLKVRARALSGGEQQMLAIGRAVLAGPAVLVLDEPTEGLAPSIVELVGELIRQQRERGVAILLLEQSGAFPHDVADVVLTMDRGLVAGALPVEAPA
jgi:branched-chain amino acid transport system ATP-binding protein